MGYNQKWKYKGFPCHWSQIPPLSFFRYSTNCLWANWYFKSYLEDGVLISEHGKIKWFGKTLNSIFLLELRFNITQDCTRLYWYPYSFSANWNGYGEQLLSWLNTYTFPTEIKTKHTQVKLPSSLFRNSRYNHSPRFLYSSSWVCGCEAAEHVQMRLIAGKVLMVPLKRFVIPQKRLTATLKWKMAW